MYALRRFNRFYSCKQSIAEKVLVFDTTLRDGEQSVGATMTYDEKLIVARQLEKLNVDIIEAGFPAVSNGEFNVVKNISEIIKEPIICALSRANYNDISIAGEAIKLAKRGRIHTFIATSDIHLQHKLKISREEAIEKMVTAVRFARSFTDDVQVGAEDATRADPEFLCTFVEEAIDAGASTIAIADTVGYSVPHEYYDLLTYLRNKVPNIRKAVLSTHCHNDLGLASANSYTGLLAGAGQVECTINGIGERAGNCSLEEIVMVTKTRPDMHNFHFDINTKELARTSRLVSQVTGIEVQAHKPIIGKNAFAHGAGIHQHGVILNKATYEIMCPQDIGLEETQYILGKHSGRHALIQWLERHRITELPDDIINLILIDIKRMSERKKHIKDNDIKEIINRITTSKGPSQKFA